MPIEVFLADDHAVMRDGLRLLLEAHPDLRVVGEAATGREAVAPGVRRLPGCADHGYRDARSERHRGNAPGARAVPGYSGGDALHVFDRRAHRARAPGRRGWLCVERVSR